jgi:integration host factor subunit beta
MTKSDLIEKLAEQGKLSKKQAEMIVAHVFDSMTAAMKAGDRIEIRGFGSFKVKHYKPYVGRNPKTGEKVEVKEKKLPFFKVGKEMKEMVDQREGASPGISSGGTGGSS